MEKDMSLNELTVTLETIKKDYFENEVCMGEILASTRADGLTIEDAFMMYMNAMNWANGISFSNKNPNQK